MVAVRCKPLLLRYFIDPPTRIWKTDNSNVLCWPIQSHSLCKQKLRACLWIWSIGFMTINLLETSLAASYWMVAANWPWFCDPHRCKLTPGQRTPSHPHLLLFFHSPTRCICHSDHPSRVTWCILRSSFCSPTARLWSYPPDRFQMWSNDQPRRGSLWGSREFESLECWETARGVHWRLYRRECAKSLWSDVGSNQSRVCLSAGEVLHTQAHKVG